LDSGGTERFLQRLVLQTSSATVHHTVISLTGGGEVAVELAARGIAVRSLEMGRRGNMPDVSAIWKLAQILRALQPDVVQAWMYHANLLAAIASPVAGTGRAIWGIRAASLPAGHERVRTIAVARISSLVARFLAKGVIVNGNRARQLHINAGYPAERMLTIPNGFDLETWRPDNAARLSVRSELGLPPHAFLIGHVANFRPIKDHATLLRAIKLLRLAGYDPGVVFIGLDADARSSAFTRMVCNSLGSMHRIFALGSRDDVPRLTAALDISVLTSIDESFPNVVAEAMASGVPVVSTDAGDVREILGSDRDVVAIEDADAIASRIAWWIDQSETFRAEAGHRLRDRVATNFSLKHVTRQFVDYWSAVAH
jgi:glycosyltransferase involved in cell wall biosynthesis